MQPLPRTSLWPPPPRVNKADQTRVSRFELSDTLASNHGAASEVERCVFSPASYLISIHTKLVPHAHVCVRVHIKLYLTHTVAV